MTLCVAIAISLLVSLTITPMMCARFLQPEPTSSRTDALYRARRARVRAAAAASTRAALALGAAPPAADARASLLATIGAERLPLRRSCPRASSPSRTPAAIGSIQAAQDISFQAMREKLDELADIVAEPIPAVEHVVGVHGRRRQHARTRRAMFVVAQAARSERKVARRPGHRAPARPKLAQVPGATLFLQACRTCASAAASSTRSTSTRCRARISTSSNAWAPRMLDAAARAARAARRHHRPAEPRACRPRSSIDRDTASRLGISAAGHRRHALRRLRPAPGRDDLHARSTSTASCWRSRRDFRQNPDALTSIYVQLADRRAGAASSAFTRFEPGTTPLAVNHQGQFPAVTLSFNLAPGVALGEAVDADRAARARRSACRPACAASFQGTAQAFQASLANQPC